METVNMNEGLSKGQLVKVKFGSYYGAIVCVESNRYYLLSDCPVLDGLDIKDYEKELFDEEEVNYSYSWVFGADDLDLTLEDIVEHYNGDNRYLRSNNIEVLGAIRTVRKIERDKFHSSKYSEDNTYSGVHDYHDSHSYSFNTPIGGHSGYKIGVELEVVANDRESYRAISQSESNWFTMEHDGSLPENGIELITIPLRPEDAKDIDFWTPLIEFLARKATAWKKSECGLHVHIGREILGDNAEQISETTGKLLYFYHYIAMENPTNTKIYGRAHTYNEHIGKTEVGDAVKTLGTEVLKDKAIKDKLDTSLKTKANESRYFDINLQNDATIEFRKGKGSINVERIVAVITYSEYMVRYVKTKDWTDMSWEDFIAFLRKELDKTNPLLVKFFPTGEQEE